MKLCMCIKYLHKNVVVIHRLERVFIHFNFNEVSTTNKVKIEYIVPGW